MYRIFRDGKDLYIVGDDIEEMSRLLENIKRRHVVFRDYDNVKFEVKHISTEHVYVHLTGVFDDV